MTKPEQPILLIDSDAFCKLGVSGLLYDSLGVLGVPIPQCRILPALPHMLRKGRLRNSLGEELADYMSRQVEAFSQADEPNIEWLESLIHLPELDSGEARLMALAAERGHLLVTGDKRAMRSLGHLPEYVSALDGSVIALEALVAQMCMTLGEETIRLRIHPTTLIDKIIAICFSPSNPHPLEGLKSYLSDLQASVAPLRLWEPSLVREA